MNNLVFDSTPLTRPKSRRGADILASALTEAGVTHVFALSGNHVMSVFDALLDTEIKIVHARHEAAAVHMADAYARVSGRIGIALVTGGPGHANAVSALYTATMAESPVVLLSGHAPTIQLGRGAFQEMAQAEMARAVTKAAWTCQSIGQLGSDFLRAVRIAQSGRPGPANLNVPSDLLYGFAEGAGAVVRPCFEQSLHPQSARELRKILSRASRPLILAGPALMSRFGRQQLLSLEQACGVPVVGMESPRGMADPSLGAFTEVVSEADCVLLLAKRLDFTLKFGEAPTFHKGCEFLQVDPEGAEIERTIMAVGSRLSAAAIADPVSAAKTIAEDGALANSTAWLQQVREAVAYRPASWHQASPSLADRLHPIEVMRPLQRVLDSHPDAIFISDGGEIGQWAQACLRAPCRIINGVAGAIGAGLPFALGARIAEPRAPIISVMGDGTAGFHITEFDTAVTYGLPFVAVVGNDARWNAEYQIQRTEFGENRARGCELRPLRYDLIAKAFGAHGEHVARKEELTPAVQRALASGGPACIDVSLDGLPAPQIKSE